MRRLKQATEPAEVAVLEKELGFLKIVNTRDLGIRALRTKLVKGRLIPKASQMNDASRFPLWPFVQDAELHKDPTLLTDKQSERVLHQVLSSKGLAEELTTAVQSLQSIVAPGRPHTKTTAESENQAVTVAELDNRENGLPAQGDSAAKAKSLAKEAAEAEPNDVENEYSSDDGFGGAAMEHSDKNLDAMVASASDSEDGYDDESEQASDSGSTFLPSLSTGFIPAAAGDDWSDAEADFADEGGGPAKSTRKNRRGQRERRAYVLCPISLPQYMGEKVWATSQPSQVARERESQAAQSTQGERQALRCIGKFCPWRSEAGDRVGRLRQAGQAAPGRLC